MCLIKNFKNNQKQLSVKHKNTKYEKKNPQQFLTASLLLPVYYNLKSEQMGSENISKWKRSDYLWILFKLWEVFKPFLNYWRTKNEKKEWLQGS